MSIEKTTFNTSYFDEETVRLAVGGCCHDFAIALHRRKGWPLACLWRLPSKHPAALILDRTPLHVFCILPDGRGIDVEGPDDIEAITQRFIGWRVEDDYEIQTWTSEQAYEDSILGEPPGSSHTLAPREHGIAGAETVIRKSAKFLALLDQLPAA